MSQQLKENLQKLEEYLLQPKIRKSIDEVNRLLADEFIEFGSSGQIFNKKQTIESLTNEAPIKRSLKDFKIKLLAQDVILATYCLMQNENHESPSICSLRSSIWKLIDNRWQVVFHQGTLQKK